MKILQACIRYPPAPGGAETHVASVSTELARRGYDVHVFCSDLLRETPFRRLDGPYVSVGGIPVRRFRGYSFGGEAHYVFMPRMFPAMLKANVDIVHAHSYGYFQVNCAAAVNRLREMPFVLTPHFHPEWSMWGGDKRRGLRRMYDRFLARPVLESADIIIGVSRHEMEQLSVHRFDRRKIRIIPNGIDFSRFEERPKGERFREHYGIPGSARVILYTGRLAVNKGLHYLVEAAPVIVREFPDTIFVLAGDDQGMGDKLERLAREKGVAEKVIFTGHIHDDALFTDAYGACDVFVLPSEYEAFGIVLLEAMACGKPCVGTRVGGVPEVIEDGRTGLVVEYADTGKLAEAIIRLLGNEEERREFGERGRLRVRERFTWEKVVDRIERVYMEVADMYS